MRAVYLHRLHFRLLALRAGALQSIRVRQRHLHRGLGVHFDGPLGGPIFRYRGSDEKTPRHGYDALISSLVSSDYVPEKNYAEHL